jgi:hypothetical protein
MARILTAIAIALVLACADDAAADIAYTPHVRVRHTALEPLLRDAIDRSPTVRRLVATLDASDVIVYLELAPRLPTPLAANIKFVAEGGGFRYLRIALSALNTRSQMLTMIGHELQHAVEIAEAPEVRSSRSLEKHYSRIGIRGLHGDESWDTRAAREAGLMVLREFVAKRF